MNEQHIQHENLVRKLCDDTVRESYENQCASVSVPFVARLLGSILVFLGNTVYGKAPSYGKFKAIEIIARIPYQSWEAAAYTLVSAFHENEEHALKLAKLSTFSRLAQDNETMHVVVISHLAKEHKQTGFFRFTLLPVLFAFFYYWVTYALYFISKKNAFMLNYVFEDHAYAQYSEFLKREEHHLRGHSIHSHFLTFYGRTVSDEYELFQTIRNDELIHRNESLARAGH
jgi:ubiquinol oxidase